jgi:hypothetical protein
MNTVANTNQAIRAEYIGEVNGIESLYGGNAYLHRYTVKHRWDENVEPITFEATNEKGTVGALLYYHYINYVGALDDIKKESELLTERAKSSIERIQKYGADTQLWVLQQTIDRINKSQADAQSALEKCYIYVDIATRSVRA